MKSSDWPRRPISIIALQKGLARWTRRNQSVQLKQSIETDKDILDREHCFTYLLAIKKFGSIKDIWAQKDEADKAKTGLVKLAEQSFSKRSINQINDPACSATNELARKYIPKIFFAKAAKLLNLKRNGIRALGFKSKIIEHQIVQPISLANYCRQLYFKTELKQIDMVKNNNFKLYTLTELNSAISRLSYDKAVGIDALQDTMCSNTSILVDNEQLETNVGVPQGSVTSPVLFNIFINDLLTALSTQPHTKVLAYAVDVAIIVKGLYSAERAIHVCEKWSEQNQININKDKSSIINLKLKCQKSIKKQFLRGIEIVNQAKFLGIVFDESGKVTPALKAKKKKEQLFSGTIKKIGQLNVTGKTRLHLWQSMIFSQVAYQTPLLSIFSKPMRSWYTSFIYRSLKTILGIRGKPNMIKLFRASLNVHPNRYWFDQLEYLAIKKVLQADEADKDTIAIKYGVGSTQNLFPSTENPII